MREQKAKYLLIGLKASRHIEMLCFYAAFGTRGRYFTRRRPAVVLNIDLLSQKQQKNKNIGVAAGLQSEV